MTRHDRPQAPPPSSPAISSACPLLAHHSGIVSVPPKAKEICTLGPLHMMSIQVRYPAHHSHAGCVEYFQSQLWF